MLDGAVACGWLGWCWMEVAKCECGGGMVGMVLDDC